MVFTINIICMTSFDTFDTLNDFVLQLTSVCETVSDELIPQGNLVETILQHLADDSLEVAKHVSNFVLCLGNTNNVFNMYDKISVQSMDLNSLSDVIFSKSVVFCLKHVQCSRIRLNSVIFFITFFIHIYKIL